MTLSRGVTASAFALILSCAPLAARADLTPGVGVGTSGLSVSLGTPIGSRFDARLQYGAFSYNTSVHSSDTSYQGKLQLSSFMMLADYHPFGSTFILSAGACFPHFSMAAAGIPNSDGSFTLNNVTFTGINSVNGTVSWNKTAPYFGIGWRPTQQDRNGLLFTADLGAAFIGSPQVNVAATGAGASNPLVQSAIISEEQSIASSANFRIFPVVNVGLVYRFGHASDDGEPTEKSEQPPQHGNTFQPN